MIVNADDFGLHEAANRGIAAAFEQGLISSTTLMANQPGFEEAVELAHERGLDEHVGVHLVLSVGIPLTDAIRRRRRFCDDEGVFHMRSESLGTWHLATLDRTSLVQELTAQVERVRATGLRVTHLDSHHQVHNHWAVGTCVIAVCKALAVPYVRLARNSGPGIGRVRFVYKRRFNDRLRRNGLARTRHFGVAADWLHTKATGVRDSVLDDFELMTHPQIDAHGDLVDVTSGIGLAELLAPVSGVASAVSYSGARVPHA